MSRVRGWRPVDGVEVLIYALLGAWGKSIGDRVTSMGWPTINNARADGDTLLTDDRCVSGFSAWCIWPMMAAIDCSKRASRPSRWEAMLGQPRRVRGFVLAWFALERGSGARDYGAFRLKIDGLLVPYGR